MYIIYYNSTTSQFKNRVTKVLQYLSRIPNVEKKLRKKGCGYSLLYFIIKISVYACI